jgi:hypothetical protein
MAETQHSMKHIRSRFDLIYNTKIIGAGFAESDDYYRLDKERYWRSLKLLYQLDLRPDVKLPEIGGGQLAVLCKKLFRTYLKISSFISPSGRFYGVYVDVRVPRQSIPLRHAPELC